MRPQLFTIQINIGFIINSAEVQEQPVRCKRLFIIKCFFIPNCSFVIKKSIILRVPVTGHIQYMYIRITMFFSFAFIFWYISVPISVGVILAAFFKPVIIEAGLIRIHDVLPFTLKALCFPSINITDEIILLRM